MPKQDPNTSRSPRHHSYRSSLTSGYLPSCRVCQKRGSGLHYGVITCDACKGFFRRNIKNQHLLRCTKNDNCDITLYNRVFCSKCRLQKCISVGMAETAIKKGRYATERKTQYIRESRREKGRQSELLNTGQTFNGQIIINPSECWSEHDQFIQMLLDLHCAHVPSMHYLKESREDDLFLQYQSKDDVYASLVDLLNTTMTCVNSVDQLQYIQREVICDIDTQIKRYINYLKNIPEFIQLSVTDQAQILKQAQFEYFLMESYPGYNTETQLVCPSVSRCFHKDELSMIWGEDLMVDLFTFAKRLKRMELSMPEVVLVEMMCIFSPDRCNLEDPEKIASVKCRTVNALLFYLHKVYSCPMARFAKIIDCIVTMRTLTEMYVHKVKGFRTWPLVRENELLLEIFEL